MKPGEQVLGVITAKGELDLYSIDQTTPVAHLLRSLDGPVGGKALHVTLSGGSTPRVCATWEINNAKNALYCYDWPAAGGYQIPTDGVNLDQSVGLSVTGHELAWTGRRNSDVVPTLFVESQDGIVRSIPGQTTRAAGYQATAIVSDVAWEGDTTVLLAWSIDDDVNGAIGLVNLNAPPHKGWTSAPEIGLTEQQWPVVQGLASSTDNDHALAIVSDAGTNMQAVQLDLTTRSISGQIAFPAAGRQLQSVSGGEHGVLYRTNSNLNTADNRIYWRAPGRPTGLPLIGIPANAWSVVAEP